MPLDMHLASRKIGLNGTNSFTFISTLLGKTPGEKRCIGKHFFHFLSTAKLKCCLDPNKKIPITKQFNKIALHHFCIQRQRQERWNIVEREFLGQQKGKVINFQFFFSFSWHLATLPTIRVSASLLLIEIDLNYRKMCSQICFHIGLNDTNKI